MGKQFPDVEWDLADPNGKIANWQNVEIAVLMDIRRELQRLNGLLHCGNFTGMPHTLNSINRKMRAQKPRKKVV